MPNNIIHVIEGEDLKNTLKWLASRMMAAHRMVSVCSLPTAMDYRLVRSQAFYPHPGPAHVRIKHALTLQTPTPAMLLLPSIPAPVKSVSSKHGDLYIAYFGYQLLPHRLFFSHPNGICSDLFFYQNNSHHPITGSPFHHSPRRPIPHSPIPPPQFVSIRFFSIRILRREGKKHLRNRRNPWLMSSWIGL
jgi:hypothetical protein